MNYSLGYTFPAVAFGLRGQISMVLKPLQVLDSFNVFLKTKDTHYAIYRSRGVARRFLCLLFKNWRDIMPTHVNIKSRSKSYHEFKHMQIMRHKKVIMITS
jgi:hypothetical protein